MGGCFSNYKVSKNSLDWVSVPSGSDYNPRSNYLQSSRKTTNSNVAEHDFSDIDNSLESALQRFVPVRPQPRGLPLSMQPSAENGDDSLQSYHQSTPNGVNPHTNHGAAAVMIVNPTTPNTLAANIANPYSVSANANRNNLARSLHAAHHAEAATGSSQSLSALPPQHARAAKNNNIDTNIFDTRVNGHVSASGLGEALVAACPDPAAVERRLGQIREYIRVTSSLVDTMRNSEDEAFIEHTKEEYDELVQMVEKLKESETKLRSMVECIEPENKEILTDSEERVIPNENTSLTNPFICASVDEPSDIETKNDANETIKECLYEEKPKFNTEVTITLVKKVSNIENEQRNEKLHSADVCPDVSSFKSHPKDNSDHKQSVGEKTDNIEEIVSIGQTELQNQNQTAEDFVPKPNNDTEEDLNAMLMKDILSCTEKLAALDARSDHQIEEECAARPMSVQSTGSGYSDSDLWHSELKAKMEVSQQRLASLQDQQKRLLKYQAEAKQHLADMQQLARERHAHDNRHRHATPTPDRPDNAHAQMIQHNQVAGSNQQQSHRMYNSNQIGVATTLPHNNHASNLNAGGGGLGSGVVVEADSTAHNHHIEDHFAIRNAHSIPHNGGERSDDDAETTGDATLSAHGRELHHKLQDLQRKKQHMENLVAEFQKLQAAEQLLGGGVDAHNNNNTYSSDESGAEDSTPHKGIKKNEDPFNLMEITAIKAALQKTKDLMRTVERYDASDAGLNEDFQLPSHSNINDNKSEGGRSAEEWSTEGSVCRSIHNTIQPGKLTNHDNRAHGGAGGGGAGSHDTSLSSLQLLTQQLRQEAEQVADERQRLRQAVSRNKDGGSGKLSKKKLLRCGSSGSGSERGASTSHASPGPLERTQHALQAELAEKQRQLAAILNKQKELSNASEAQNIKHESCGYAINRSYNSEQDEGESQVEDIFPAHPHSQPEQHYQNTDGGAYADGSAVPPPPAHGNYFSDSDNGSRCKSDTRSLSSCRGRTLMTDRAAHQNVAGVPVNMPDPAPPPNLLQSQTVESSRSTPSFPPAMPPSHLPPPPAWSNKSNQDCRSNQFTTNSHSQTSLEQLLGMQQVYSPSVPFNVMMPYGAFQGGAGACGCWGLWCWQQLAAQQREIHQLRDQLNSLEERWRAETPHALNNQVPPGNRANNYWDNFRSYSRQNLLSTHSKTNADGNLGGAPPHPQPLAARSHNALHPPATRDNRHPPRAPDVLNHDPQPSTHNLNRARPATDTLHANNLADAVNHKKKPSKMPAENSATRRNCSLDYVHNDNINIASSSRAPNPNLASAGRDKASKMFDLMRENVYSEVTALISANESHPDFLLQLFRDLQSVSSDAMRRSALQSIRNLTADGRSTEVAPIASSDRTDDSADRTIASRNGPIVFRDIVDFMIAHGEEICTPDLLEAFKAVVVNVHRDAAQSMPYSQKKLQELLSKYEGSRLREVSARIIDDLTSVPNREEEQRGVAEEGATGGYSWEDADPEGSGVAGRLASEGRVDLIDCVEMYNGDLAEADQTCSSEPDAAAAVHEPADLLPDLVETEEITPTEAEAGWLGLDRVPTRLHTDDSPANQKD